MPRPIPRLVPHPARVSSAAASALAVLSLLTVSCAKAPPARQRPSVTVAVVNARRATIPYTIDANGVVVPMQTAAVASQVDGIVKDVAFEEGQEVSQGQVLFRIDPRPYENAYELAKATLARDSANLANAEGEVARYEPLEKDRFTTKEQADQLRATAAGIRATMRADAATLATAKFNLENTTVRAPISGKTGAVLVRTGNLARAAGGAPLVVINQVRPIMVRFAVPASELELLLQYGAHGGLPVTAIPGGNRTAAVAATLDSATSPTLDVAKGIGAGAAAQQGAARGATPNAQSFSLNESGTLSFVDNAVDTTTETVMLKAKFPNTSGHLWAGQFASTTLKLFDENDAVVIPSQCVVTGQRGTYVYVIDSSLKAEQRPVTVERTSGDLSIIGNGLVGGEQVVTDGQSRLTPGSTVTIRTPDGGGGNGGGGNGRGGRGGGRGGRGGGRRGGGGGNGQGGTKTGTP